MKDLLERAEKFIESHDEITWGEMLVAFAAQELSREWVPVSDRLPDDYQAIWVTYSGGEVVGAVQQKNILVTDNGESDVIAWMPRTKPEPYKELT